MQLKMGNSRISLGIGLAEGGLPRLSGSAGCCRKDELFHVIPRHSIELPLLHVLGADPVVEIDGKRVPVEDRPLHPSATPSMGFANEVTEHRDPETGLPEIGGDENILQVERRESEEA